MKQVSLLDEPQINLPTEFELRPGYLSNDQANQLLAKLLDDLEWERPDVQVWGKRHTLPRSVHWQGDPGAGYRYSGVYRDPATWHPWLARLRDKLAEDTGHFFNSVLANLYENGSDKVGWHADDEPELGSQPIIASLSLGAERDFRIRRKDQSGMATNIALKNGSLLIMHPGTQAYWEHCIPPRAKVTQPRINLTFRQVIG